MSATLRESLNSSFGKYFIMSRVDKLSLKYPRMIDLLRLDQLYGRDNSIDVEPSVHGKDVNPNAIRSWTKLPNVRGFSVKVSPWDWVFAIFGLRKRLTPKLQFHPYSNLDSNRYVEYMYQRLTKQVSIKEYDKAVETMWILMNSKSYLACCYNKVVRNWHRELPLWLVEKHLSSINEMVKARSTAIDYKRVYFWDVKKYRPLGVPSIPWRVYLHMYNNLLVQWRMHSETGVQHAYLPGKGALTAWNQIVKLLNQPNIYESDYKGFFDNVSHNAIKKVLLENLNLPEAEVEFLMDLNRSIVVLPKERPIAETDVDVLSNLYNEVPPLSFEWSPPGSTSKPILIDLTRPNPEGREKFVKDWMYWDQNILGNVPKDDLVYKPSFASLKEDSSHVKMKGVPQGAPTSCSLATLALRPLEKHPIKIYADDILAFPKSSTEDPNSWLHIPSDGLITKPEGCRWLKKDGKWLVESFKFLGVRYHPPRKVMVNLPLHLDWEETREVWITIPEKFETETRQGRKLAFTRRESLLSWLSKSRDHMLYGLSKQRHNYSEVSLPTWLVMESLRWSRIRGASRLLWNNKLTGWFLSRMYIGDWKVAVKQNFVLTFKKGSWQSFRWPLFCEEEGLNFDDVTIFTASSFACKDLLRMIEDSRKPKLKNKGRLFRRVLVSPKYDQSKTLGYLTPIERFYKRFRWGLPLLSPRMINSNWVNYWKENRK